MRMRQDRPEMMRRRQWQASGCLPPQMAACFPVGQHAVLAVIATEIMAHGDCRLSFEEIAVEAGGSTSNVRKALNEARRLGFISPEGGNLSNMSLSPEWRAWLSYTEDERQAIWDAETELSAAEPSHPPSARRRA